MRELYPVLGASPRDTSSILFRCWLAVAAPWIGCTASQAQLEPPTRRPLGAEYASYVAAYTGDEKALDSELPAEPTGDLTLRDALAAALLRNPDLAAFSWEIRVREARALQAALRPNPELFVDAENIGGSDDFDGADQAETTVALGQLIELGGKRLKRRRVAELDATLAGWDYEMQRVAVFAAVARAFADVLVAQRGVELSRELQQLAEESLVSLDRQVRAGATSPIERTRAQVTVAAREIERQHAEGTLRLARFRLAALWGGPEARFDAVRGDLGDVTPPPALPALLARIHESPELARWVEEVALREAVIDLEDSKRIPDVTAVAGVRRLEQSNDTAFVVGVSVPLPVYDRNQGARLAAHRDLAKARHLRRSAQIRTEMAVRTSLSDLGSSYSEVQALREVALPRAQTALGDAREAYQRGLLQYIDVLDTQRTLFELRTRELEALQRYHTAVADLERLTGAPLPELSGPNRE